LNLISVAATIAVLTATALPAQRAPGPAEWLDSTRALPLLDEVTAALVEAPGLRADQRFIDWVAELHRSWGRSDSSVLALYMNPASVVPGLLAVGRLDDALSFIRSHRGRYFEQVASALLAATGPEHALSIADSLNASSVVVRLVLEDDAVDRHRRVATIRAWLGGAGRRSPQRAYILELLVRFIAESDYAAALSEADSIGRVDGIELRHALAEIAYRMKLPFADSLLNATYHHIRQLDDPDERQSRLLALAGWCGISRRPPCEPFDLPSRRRQPALLANDLQTAFDSAGLDSVARVRDRLARETTTEVVVLASFLALERIFCQTAGCSSDLERWTLSTVADAERALQSDVSASLADQLRSFVAIHTVTRNPTSAFAVLERIHSDSLRSAAWAIVAARLVDVNVPAARRALALANDHHRRAEAAVRLYPLLLTLGDSAAAQQVLGLVEPWQALGAEMERAGGLLLRGQHSDARDVAIASLRYWVPSQHTFVSNYNAFRIFRQVGAVEELIAWTRARQRAEDRAIAIAAVLGGFTPWENRQRAR
jgi:hypothetical protein